MKKNNMIIAFFVLAAQGLLAMDGNSGKEEQKDKNQYSFSSSSSGETKVEATTLSKDKPSFKLGGSSAEFRCAEGLEVGGKYKPDPNYKGPTTRVIGIKATVCIPEGFIKGKEVPSISLGMPCYNNGKIWVGTDDPGEDTGKKYLMCFESSFNFLTRNEGKKVLIFDIEDQVRDIKPLGLNRVAVACGKGKVKILEVDKDNSKIKLVREMHGKYADENLHKNFIRELAVLRTNGSLLVSGGFDKQIWLSDVEKGQAIQNIPVTDTVGSLRTIWSENDIITFTLDGGCLGFIDFRDSSMKPTLSFNSKKTDLFAHEPVSFQSWFLGFADAELQRIDMRKIKSNSTDHIVARIEDPFCDGIGDIRYYPEADRLICCGLSDYTVYGNVDDKMDIETHSEANLNVSLSYEYDVSQFAIHFVDENDNNCIFSANTDGYMRKITLDKKKR